MNYFDLHCDTPHRSYINDLPLNDSSLAVNLGYNGFEKWHQCFAVWIDDNCDNPFEIYRKTLSNFKEKLQHINSDLTPHLMVENGALLENQIERLETLKSDGIKSLTLTWNNENCIAGGCCCDARLKSFGKEVIMELNRLGLACDLAHLNKRSFFDAIEYAEKPYISHTCIESVYSHRRNIKLEQAQLISRMGGIIGVCFYPEFLPQGDVFDGIHQNLFTLLEAGLENSISIGSDFDGADMDERLSNIEQIGNLYAFLLQKGIEKLVLDKIFFENAFRFYTKL